jgi:valyl-tRNA synthetase
MEIPKTYDPSAIEDKWYSHWLKHEFFKSVPDTREPYTIVIPPPNVTGVLHMGHMLNNTLQDVLIRRARMLGKNACWVPGTDHASIATEAKVVAMLKEKGIAKTDLSREKFLEHAWEWKEKYGGIILEQLKKLGASCDWDRTRFTMEADMSEAVIDVFIDLHKKGLIYRGARMVNWDPAGLTAVSDEEVIHKEVNSKLYYVRYKIEDALDEWITVATTRPETILGDTAICVHPEDQRYAHLKGKQAIVPVVNRVVPIIFDEYISMEFGTGALKVTPAHDINDYNLGMKHHLQVIDILNPNGTISPAGGHYIGEDRFIVRKKISKDLEASGNLVKTEDIKNKVGYSERTDAVIEPRLSTQWFFKMEGVSKPALENVMNDSIKLVPEKFKNTYKHWMENIHDWCISRQLWWGQQIPAWYNDKGLFVIAKTKEEAVLLFQSQHHISLTVAEIKQDEDVLDTWFSSWLWPISVFDGFKNPDNPDIKYYYPTNDLVTAPEILFFWVARMIIAGYEYRGEKPFSNIYLHGIVRDKQGRKMSKSLGNSPDPLDLIKQYGADGVRVGMLLCSPAGNDLPFDEGLCAQGRNFSNKIWNAFRLVQGWEIDPSLGQSKGNKVAIEWFQSKLSYELAIINDHYQKYRISEALMASYKLVWDDFCAWFLEMIKPEYTKPIDRSTYDASIDFFGQLLKILHPFMPFITEELWHLIVPRQEKECILIAEWPVLKASDTALLDQFNTAAEIITGIRNIRKQKNISPKEIFTLSVGITEQDAEKAFYPTIQKLGNLSGIHFVEGKVAKASMFMVHSIEYFVPVDAQIDQEEELKKLTLDLEYTKGFLEAVMKKLSNERFVSNAKPEVLETERKKQGDAVLKIKLLEAQLEGFK